MQVSGGKQHVDANDAPLAYPPLASAHECQDASTGQQAAMCQSADVPGGHAQPVADPPANAPNLKRKRPRRGSFNPLRVPGWDVRRPEPASPATKGRLVAAAQALHTCAAASGSRVEQGITCAHGVTEVLPAQQPGQPASSPGMTLDQCALADAAEHQIIAGPDHSAHGGVKHAGKVPPISCQQGLPDELIDRAGLHDVGHGTVHQHQRREPDVEATESQVVASHAHTGVKQVQDDSDAHEGSVAVRSGANSTIAAAAVPAAAQSNAQPAMVGEQLAHCSGADTDVVCAASNAGPSGVAPSAAVKPSELADPAKSKQTRDVADAPHHTPAHLRAGRTACPAPEAAAQSDTARPCSASPAAGGAGALSTMNDPAAAGNAPASMQLTPPPLVPSPTAATLQAAPAPVLPSTAQPAVADGQAAAQCARPVSAPSPADVVLQSDSAHAAAASACQQPGTTIRAPAWPSHHQGGNTPQSSGQGQGKWGAGQARTVQPSWAVPVPNSGVGQIVQQQANTNTPIPFSFTPPAAMAHGSFSARPARPHNATQAAPSPQMWFQQPAPAHGAGVQQQWRPQQKFSPMFNPQQSLLHQHTMASGQMQSARPPLQQQQQNMHGAARPPAAADAAGHAQFAQQQQQQLQRYHQQQWAMSAPQQCWQHNQQQQQQQLPPQHIPQQQHPHWTPQIGRQGWHQQVHQSSWQLASWNVPQQQQNWQQTTPPAQVQGLHTGMHPQQVAQSTAHGSNMAHAGQAASTHARAATTPQPARNAMPAPTHTTQATAAPSPQAFLGFVSGADARDAPQSATLSKQQVKQMEQEVINSGCLSAEAQAQLNSSWLFSAGATAPARDAGLLPAKGSLHSMRAKDKREFKTPCKVKKADAAPPPAMGQAAASTVGAEGHNRGGAVASSSSGKGVADSASTPMDMQTAPALAAVGAVQAIENSVPDGAKHGDTPEPSTAATAAQPDATAEQRDALAPANGRKPVLTHNRRRGAAPRSALAAAGPTAAGTGSFAAPRRGAAARQEHASAAAAAASAVANVSNAHGDAGAVVPAASTAPAPAVQSTGELQAADAAAAAAPSSSAAARQGQGEMVATGWSTGTGQGVMVSRQALRSVQTRQHARMSAAKGEE